MGGGVLGIGEWYSVEKEPREYNAGSSGFGTKSLGKFWVRVMEREARGAEFAVSEADG